jgi:hypothetical protein
MGNSTAPTTKTGLTMSSSSASSSPPLMQMQAQAETQPSVKIEKTPQYIVRSIQPRYLFAGQRFGGGDDLLMNNFKSDAFGYMRLCAANWATCNTLRTNYPDTKIQEKRYQAQANIVTALMGNEAFSRDLLTKLANDKKIVEYLKSKNITVDVKADYHNKERLTLIFTALASQQAQDGKKVGGSMNETSDFPSNIVCPNCFLKCVLSTPQN